MRGRLVSYSGEQVTRPMKDRTREAVFNLLGPAVKGAHVVDWFAGTGVLAIEAVSRGALSATLVERHIPTYRLIQRSVTDLNIAAKCELVRGDAFFSAPSLLPRAERTIHFFSPPYDLFVDQQDAMVELIRRCAEQSPVGSELVVESDIRFNYEEHLDLVAAWRVRTYSPAIVAIGRTE
jgi:16S rRNA (guanine(966)-N(2))-methyltransferase RsmD